MSDFLRIEVATGEQLASSLQAALARIQSPAPLMQRLGARLEEAVQARFDDKRDPDGRPWAPLASATVAKYAKEDTLRSPRAGARTGEVLSRGTLLERTRQMRASLSSNSGDDYAEVTMSRLTDGGDWSVPWLHETGTTQMPRRGLLFSDPDAGRLGAEDEAMLDEEVSLFLDEVFGG